jgi:hypothetical protein
MKRPRRRFLHLAAGAVALPTVARFAWAQTYPSRPVTIVVPYPAGGLFDALARILAEHMRGTLSQTVVIENVGGAGGSIAVGRVARAAPDGYTLSIGSGDQFVVNAAIYPLQYDVVKDFDPVALLVSGPTLIVSKTAVPTSTLKELIAWLKANHEKVVQGHNGSGGAQHLCGIELQRAAKRNVAVRTLSRGCPGAAGHDRRTARRDVPVARKLTRHGGRRSPAGLRRHRRQSSCLRARRPNGRGGGIPGDAHFNLGRAVRAQGDAQDRDRQAQFRRDARIGRSGRGSAIR